MVGVEISIQVRITENKAASGLERWLSQREPLQLTQNTQCLHLSIHEGSLTDF